MDKSMLPSLNNFGIDAPGYIRKIDRLKHWDPENFDNLKSRAKVASERVFKPNSRNLHSLWYVETAEQFYGMVSVLSAGRTPRNQNIDFLWIDAEELDSTSIKPEPVPEGQCLFVSSLHFNAYIDPIASENLCLIMMQAGRKAQRCKEKKHTKLILEYQTERGCKATETSKENCDCEVVSL